MRTNKEILKTSDIALEALIDGRIAYEQAKYWIDIWMKEAQKEIVEHILQRAAESAKVIIYDSGDGYEEPMYKGEECNVFASTQSILSLKDELIKEIENL